MHHYPKCGHLGDEAPEICVPLVNSNNTLKAHVDPEPVSWKLMGFAVIIVLNQLFVGFLLHLV
jgi:hypothetical protein